MVATEFSTRHQCPKLTYNQSRGSLERYIIIVIIVIKIDHRLNLLLL